MKSLFLFTVCFLTLSFASAKDVATVGFPQKIKKYCLENKTDNDGVENKCRTLVLTENALNGFFPFYERFEKWSVEDDVLNLSVDAVTYFKGKEAFFDSEYSALDLHVIDKSYPENTNIKVSLDENGLPTISNLHLARFETDELLGYAVVEIDYEPKKVTVAGRFYVYSKDEHGNKSTTPVSDDEVSETYLLVD